MDIVQAKAIPLRRIFEVCGSSPIPIKNGLYLYQAPFDSERKSMLVVNPATNTWVDPMTNGEGDGIQLVCLYLLSENLNHSVMDAMRWLQNMIGNRHPQIMPQGHLPDYQLIDGMFQVKDETYLRDHLLIQYLEHQRAIPFHLARSYFRQVSILNNVNGKSFVALAVENEDGGYAIRNPLHKAHIGKHAIRFVRGRIPKPTSVHVFKDMFDYLSAVLLRQGKPFDGDSIILNSYDCLQDMAAYISNYGYECLNNWLDNDPVGNNCTAALKEFCKIEQLVHYNQQAQYKGFKDLNEYWVALHPSVANGIRGR